MIMHAAILVRLGIASAIAGTLAYHGHKKKSLSLSGCCAAFVVGLGSMGCSYRFGLLLLFFYYSSTKLTKYKQDVKDRMEEDFKSAGERNWQQVFASSLLAIIVSLTYVIYFGEDKNASFIPPTSTEDIGRTMITILNITKPRYLWISQLQCMYVAHFATANGDTWASEVGMLAKSEPRLITSFFMKKVPPGTNGGMSVLGTFASAMGGAFIGLIYYIYSFLPGLNLFTLDSPSSSQWIMIVFGFLCGLLGSVLDSLLGATLQATYYSDEKKMIIKNVDSTTLKGEIAKGHIRRISGVDILSNEMVNILSIALTMAISWFIAPWLFHVCEGRVVG